VAAPTGSSRVRKGGEAGELVWGFDFLQGSAWVRWSKGGWDLNDRSPGTSVRSVMRLS
jgi:hypothetical protein